jgi:hypothetical protein
MRIPHILRMELSCRIDAETSRMKRCCLNMNLLLKHEGQSVSGGGAEEEDMGLLGRW